MSETNLVRPSRDGDQFHYIWATRRCLLLLSPNASLKAVTIEGPSLSETVPEEGVKSGEELIDVGEYYGSENLKEATSIRYIQLKHSTLREDEAWTPSGLEKTLAGFAKRYKELQEHLNTVELNEKLEFWFVSNRPINTNFLETIQDTAEGAPARHKGDLKKLESFTSLSGIELQSFCKLLYLEGSQDGLWDQQNILAHEVNCYLPDTDVDVPVLLKELVTRKALSASSDNPSITRMDVLRALKTDVDHMFPVPSLIKDLKNAVPREQETELLQAIMGANGVPVIVHAAGGIGKSVFASRIKLGLPAGSSSILYDCFGDGQYRSASGYRHRHKDALVQIVNELAAMGLCHPLIPTPHAESSAYLKTFIYRLKQSIDSIRSKSPEALLYIIIDAADNAQMASEEIGEARSFVRDLIREQLPEGVRLITLCRTHRQGYLDPPPDTLRLELLPFSHSETSTYLRQVFADASEQDVDEFHRLSSQNPRVQALALSQKAPLNEILRALGPNPNTVEDTIKSLLENSVARLRDATVSLEKTQIDKICAGLAILRPLIPLSVLASISGVDETAIKSFAYDLGRPVLVAGDTIQFLDEPAESWFRENFKPSEDDLKAFVASLKPLATNSAYVASALPQLMLEAGLFEDLVRLALSSEALPSTNPVQKRDIELQRLQFAFKASLRSKHYAAAAKLALKAGGESAGNERQRTLLQANTDLAAIFLDSERIQELVSRKTFGSGWVGSHHAYEAALLSGHEELLGDARSRLRMAGEWLRNWSRLSNEERDEEKVSDEDILEMATAIFNIHGADACTNWLHSWTPRDVSFRVGRLLVSRFIDHGRYHDIDKLALAGDNDICLILAITLELRQIHRVTPKNVLERVFRLVLNPRIKLKDSGHWNDEGKTIHAITALVEAAYIQSVGTREEYVVLLTRYLPTRPPLSLSSPFDRQRFNLLRAYVLKATLEGKSLDLIDLANNELRKKLEDSKSHSESQDIREFKETIGALLPWYKLWATAVTGHIPPTKLPEAIATTRGESAKAIAMSYREEPDVTNEIARIWFDILTTKSYDYTSLDVFDQWVASHKRPLFTTTLTYIARLAARIPSFESRSFDYANKAFGLIRDEREDAELKSYSYLALARALLTTSKSEALAYFNQAVEVANKIGDENIDRWEALLDLADRAASANRPTAETAYRLARCAELTYHYVARDKYFAWESTVKAISGLCGKSSLAILSRWRDRDFGQAERILPVAINFLITRGDLDPKIALSLISFRAQWNEPQLLKNVLASNDSKASKEAAVEFTYRYMTLEHQSSAKWKDLRNIVSKNGIMSPPELDERISFSEHEEQVIKAKEYGHGAIPHTNEENKEKYDWNQIFVNTNLSIADNISIAYRRYKDSEPPYYFEKFFEEAINRVQVGKEAEFISAMAVVADFSLYHLRVFLEQLPIHWQSRLAFKPALAQTLKSFLRRFCMEVTMNRYYQGFLPKAYELAGISESEAIDEVLSAIGETTEIVNAGRLFTLVALLATKITEDEALETLLFGLDLLDPLLEDTDGDGPWLPKLEPPANIEGSVAGYIWGCLAAPRTSLRWEATHTVRALCTFGHEKILEQLISMASGVPVDAFYDSRLFFYELHARQWLLIGLSYSAKEHPDLLVPYIDFFTGLALTSEPHVLIREFAKRTIFALVDGGCIEPSTDLLEQLSVINVSTFPPVESKSYRHFEDEDTNPENNEDRFSFGIDMGPYWFEPLGRRFGKSQSSIEREASQVIRKDWQISSGTRWDQDERHKRKIFRDRETYHSHGEYPRVDELHFYLSYHAMMVVAGRLLSTTPVHYDPYDSEDEFRSWLSRHDLSRHDGNWLADRRDPIPLERPIWKDEKENTTWHLSIAKNDFDLVLMAPDDRINLWGSWTWIAGHREETIHISSALVSSDRSMALLRALQSVADPYDYRIPDAEDNLQIDYDDFQLKGWIIDPSSNRRIDIQDPWAGDIKFPSPFIAPYITELMNITTDIEQRRWYSLTDGIDVAWSQVWGHFRDKDDEETNQEYGNRLQVSFSFIVSLLQKLKMDLIVNVEIQRYYRYSQWERNKNEFEYIPRSTRLFLIKSDGNISTL